MEAIGAVLSRTEVLCGVFSLIGAVFGYLSVRATAAQEERKRKAEMQRDADDAKAKLELAAREAKDRLRAEARRDAINEWQALYGEREKQVHDLAAQNKDQQSQIDNLRDGQEKCQEQHRECEERDAQRAVEHSRLKDEHESIKAELSAVKGTVTKIANGNH